MFGFLDKWFNRQEPQGSSGGVPWDAARTDRRAAGWDAPSSDFLQYTSPELIRRRARHAVRNSPTAARAVQALTDNVIGTGIRPTLKLEPALKALVQARWNTWANECDLLGRDDFYNLQSLTLRQLVTDGESLLRLVLDDDVLRLQALPAEFLDSGVQRQDVVAGVEFDAIGRRVGYHVFDQPPTNILRLPQSRRVEARNVLHIFREQIAGQVRGVSWLGPVLMTMRDADDFSKAVLVKARTAALFCGFVTSPGENPLGASAAADGSLQASLEPGTLQKLDPGEMIEFSPNADLKDIDPYMRTLLRSIAAGIGLPYSVLTGDLNQENYSSARVALIEFSKFVRSAQRQFIFQALRPIWRRWIEVEVLAGRLPLPAGGIQVYIDGVSWAAPALQLTDPQREADGMIRLVRAGFKSADQVIAELGLDRESVYEAQAAANADADRLGLILDSDPRKVTQQGNPAPQPAPGEGE